MENASPESLTVLVLAASREGFDDPVARLQQKSHKCLVEIDGTPMLERVVQALMDSGCFNRILISIENAEVVASLPVVNAWLEQGRVALVPSAATLADSLIELGNNDDNLLPLVVTTADNVLHTPDLIRDFVSISMSSECDVSVAASTEEKVLECYANEGIRFFRFKDGGFSFCNLFGIRTVSGINAVNIFRSGGQFRKKPWRILKVFGVMSLIRYKFGLITFADTFGRIGKKLGIVIKPVLLPYSFGPIDVDNANSFRISEETLKKRRAA